MSEGSNLDYCSANRHVVFHSDLTSYSVVSLECDAKAS